MIKKYKRNIAAILAVITVISSITYTKKIDTSAKTAHKNVTKYFVTTRDEFFTILFDEASTCPNGDVVIYAKGNLASKLEKELDSFYGNVKSTEYELINCKKYVKKYKNRQAFSYNDIANQGGFVWYDTKQSKRTKLLELRLYNDTGKKVRKQFESKARKALMQMDLENLSDAERIELVADWICDNMTYGDAKKYIGSSAALIGKKAVCCEYALITSAMLDAIGIDSVEDSGYSEKSNKESAHAWNIVKVKGKWYNVDTCWRDAIGTGYLLKGSNSEEFKERERLSECTLKQYKIEKNDYVDDGYQSPLRAWLIGISDINVKTTVGKKVSIQKDRLKNVTSSNTKIVEVKNGKLIAKKKGRVTITRTDGKYISQFYVLVK